MSEKELAPQMLRGSRADELRRIRPAVMAAGLPAVVFFLSLPPTCWQKPLRAEL